MNPKTLWESLERERQVAVVIVGVCGIFALVLSFMYLQNQIRSPFYAPKVLLKRSEAILAQREDENKKLDELKTKDTDRDGLSDYAEIYIYHTSPYLTDSDSDGIADAIEIAQETNPNCPEGKICIESSNAEVQGTASSSAADFLNVTPVPQGLPDVLLGGVSASSVSGAQEFVASPPMPDSMTPDQIRSYLVSHGLAQPDQVTALPDNLILQVYNAAYQEALRVQAASRQVPSSTISNP